MPRRPRVALLFPGQGSQRPGMGVRWLGTTGWDVVAELEASSGQPIEYLLLRAGADELRSTRAAQISTFALAMVALRSLPPLDVAAVAGHSLGEYSALVAAGALSLAQGARLVSARGEAMRRAAEDRPGTMSAVLGLDDETVNEILSNAAEVWPASYNAPGHVVISGTIEGVAAAATPLRSAGARRLMPLPVGGAFHTALMAPARGALEAALDEAGPRSPELPVLANVTAEPHGSDSRELLSAQLTAPVRWRQSLEALRRYGVELVVEVGPGGVLAGLARRTLPELRTVSVGAPPSLELL